MRRHVARVARRRRDARVDPRRLQPHRRVLAVVERVQRVVGGAGMLGVLLEHGGGNAAGLQRERRCRAALPASSPAGPARKARPHPGPRETAATSPPSRRRRRDRALSWRRRRTAARRRRGRPSRDRSAPSPAAPRASAPAAPGPRAPSRGFRCTRAAGCRRALRPSRPWRSRRRRAAPAGTPRSHRRTRSCAAAGRRGRTAGCAAAAPEVGNEMRPSDGDGWAARVSAAARYPHRATQSPPNPRRNCHAENLTPGRRTRREKGLLCGFRGFRVDRRGQTRTSGLTPLEREAEHHLRQAHEPGLRRDLAEGRIAGGHVDAVGLHAVEQVDRSRP